MGDVPFEHGVFRGSVVVWSFVKLIQGWCAIKEIICFVTKLAGILLLPECHHDMKYRPTRVWDICLGYDVLSLGSWFPTFRASGMIWSLKVFLGISTFMGLNFGIYISSGTLSYPRRTAASSTPLRKPRNSHTGSFFECRSLKRMNVLWVNSFWGEGRPTAPHESTPWKQFVSRAVLECHCGPEFNSRYSDWLQAGRSGDRISVGARFSTHFQTGRGAHPTFCATGIPGLFLGGKAAGAWC